MIEPLVILAHAFGLCICGCYLWAVWPLLSQSFMEQICNSLKVKKENIGSGLLLEVNSSSKCTT